MDLEIIIVSEGSQRERETNVIWYHLCVESLKMIQMNLFTNRNRLTDIENKLMVTKGESGGRDTLGV